MKRLKVGLNGFGRIGRAFTRIALKRDSFDIVLINTRKTKPSMLAYLLQYDSIYRRLPMEVKEEIGGISVNGKKIYSNNSSQPEEIPWDKYQVDVVVEATGAFRTKTDLERHFKGAVKKVILSAPAKDQQTPHVVLKVNDDTFDFKDNRIISMASCTTNCASVMFKILDDNFKIVSGFLTTTHAYTQSQNLLDNSSKTKTRGRSASQNIVPTSTGAAKAVIKTLPHLNGKIDAMAVRVPVPTVSFSDISATVEKTTTAEEINERFKQAAQGPMKGVLSYETESLVSSDFIGSPYSCIFDANYTKVINGNFVKIFGWYDNEWGYSTRLADLVERLANFL